jgi:hypothetical protein
MVGNLSVATKKPALTGRAAKNALMKDALEQAGKGLCSGFSDVLRALETRGIDVTALRLYASANDVDAIDRRCRDVRAIRFPKGKS